MRPQIRTRTFIRGRARRGERGQALVFFAVALTMLLAVGGLVLDGSNLQHNKRKLQNAADAAAFAGAYDLTRYPVVPSQATTDAVQWLTKNGSGNPEVVTNAVSTTTTPNDTITVQLKRTVPYSIMKVLGLSSGDVAASAKVRVSQISGCDSTANPLCLYSVWYRDPAGHPWTIGTYSDPALMRSNAWVQKSVQNPGPGPGTGSTWVGNSKDFKGFLRTDTGDVTIGQNYTKGGNACGQEQAQVDALNAAWNSSPYGNGAGSSPAIVIIPMLGAETGNGIALVTVITYVALDIHIPQNTYPFKCPADFYGVIVNLDAAAPGYTTGTGTPPPGSLGCGTGIGACKAVLVQ